MYSARDQAYFRYSSTESRTLYYTPGLSNDRGSVLTFGPGDLTLVPFFTGYGGYVNGGAALTLSAGSSMIRVALYARISSYDIRPGDLYADLGSWTSGGKPAITSLVHSLAAHVLLQPHDMLWLAFVANSNWGTGRVAQTQLPQVLGNPNNDFATGREVLTMSWAYGAAWPATLPQSWTPGAGLFGHIGLSVTSINRIS
jgi:hypothetical protein